jgi:hypothetical protein
MIERDVINEVAKTILEADPDPVVHLRLLRDVLKYPLDTVEVLHAQRYLSTSRWVQELEREQWRDGSWGRFHTEDTKAKQKIATTEDGVSRAIALGLDTSHPVLQKAVKYITCILDGTLEWRDWREVSWGQSWWDSSVQLLSAATLAQIQPNLEILDAVWDLWYRIVHRAFPSGQYSRGREIQAHLELRGIKDISEYARKSIERRGALSGFSKYHVALLGSQADRLPHQLEKAYLTKIWNQGIGYLGVPPAMSPVDLLKKTPLQFEAWLSSIELLTPFRSWRTHAKKPVDWLWEQRSQEGGWDFGPRSTRSTYFPLSESWRKKRNREFDWTTRVLVLLRKYYDQEKLACVI